MASEIKNIAKKQVAYRATLDAYTLVLHDLHQLWVIRQMESMANSLGVEQDGIVQLLVSAVVRLAAVQIHWELSAHACCLLPRFVDLVEEMVNFRREVFFVNHVEANNHVSIFPRLKYRINLRLNVPLANNFQATAHNLHLKQWEQDLNLFLYSLKDGELFLKGKRAIFIKDHAKNVFPLNYCAALFNHILADSVQNHLEELGVVV